MMAWGTEEESGLGRYIWESRGQRATESVGGGANTEPERRSKASPENLQHLGATWGASVSCVSDSRFRLRL